ncbi:MAG: PQQ-dependent sugar dehydrogenase [Gemmatimonadota bacterium]|nr:PQQ-dependent sugar dehydrogenase [Gemmatimonadota bacterium]
MTRFHASAAVAGLALLVSTPVMGQTSGDVHQAKFHDYRVVTVADGFEIPWSMAFLPNGDMLVTERPGRLRMVRNGRLMPSPIAGTPTVHAQGQGGLLEVAVHPDFASNRMVYLSYSKPVGDNSTTAIGRGRLEGERLVGFEDIFVADSRGNGHYGSRIVFDGEGHLFFSVGDRQAPSTGNLEAHPAQDRSNHHGTINRINDDGSIPSDNPFVGMSGVEPSIYSFGHRNAQGMVMDASGRLWATEHGPQGGDELNLIVAGGNYGWPVVGYGVNYRSGSTIHEGTMREGWQNPHHVWVPSIGVSGLAIYDGARFPQWRGSVLAGGLSGEYLARLTLEDGEVVDVERLLVGMGRVRDVRQGPDGYIYVAIERRDGAGTPIVRLEPAG